jgi:hypothetical protein
MLEVAHFRSEQTIAARPLDRGCLGIDGHHGRCPLLVLSGDHHAPWLILAAAAPSVLMPPRCLVALPPWGLGPVVN